MSTFNITVERGFVVVRMYGPPSEQNARAMLAVLHAEIAKTNVGGALFEIDVTGGLDNFQILEIVKDLPRLGFKPSFKFGILLIAEEARNAVAFAETAALNRGWKVKIFTDPTSARNWLASY
jgi:hypothetical protein